MANSEESIFEIRDQQRTFCPNCNSNRVERDGEAVFDDNGEYLGYQQWWNCQDCGESFS